VATATYPKSRFAAIRTRGRLPLIGRPLAEACARARISPSVSLHILRHSHGSTLAMRGVPMGVIAAQLGHSDTRMTEKHYAHLAPSYVADTIRANFPNLGLTNDAAVTNASE
jgi:integrase